jgi:hypothetical protein
VTRPIADLIRGTRPTLGDAFGYIPIAANLCPTFNEGLIPSLSTKDTLFYWRGWLVIGRGGDPYGGVCGDDAGKVWWVPARAFRLLPVDLTEEGVTEALVCKAWARLRRKGVTWKEMEMVEYIRGLREETRAEIVRLIQQGQGEE